MHASQSILPRDWQNFHFGNLISNGLAGSLVLLLLTSESVKLFPILNKIETFTRPITHYSEPNVLNHFSSPVLLYPFPTLQPSTLLICP